MTDPRPRFIVQFSTGLGSAESARRTIETHGPKAVILLTADTRVEDPDNWRFAHEFVNRFGRGCQWHILADGRTPMQVGRDARAVPNDRMAICSRVLKRELLRKWVDANCDPATDRIVIGFDWTEQPRIDDARPHWQPFTLVTPMWDEPLIDKFALEFFYREDLGIEPPRLYNAVPRPAHANCGGFCVRGGQQAWADGLVRDRAGYLVWEGEEEMTMAMLGKKVTILKSRTKEALASNGGKAAPLTLREFREHIELGGAHDGDMGACGCDPYQQITLDFAESGVS